MKQNNSKTSSQFDVRNHSAKQDKPTIQNFSINRKNKSSLVNTLLRNANGKIPYGMTNDYMFRAVLQSNNKVLRGLICALLHLSEEEVRSVEITNPVVIGEAVESKEFRLDINVILNNQTLINLEMQIANRLNWRERSVMYLCRSFDSLNHGQDYTEAKPAVHIGFLDYTLFEEHPEFYASYKLINVKNYQKYSDSITLNVVDLSRIDLATEEDRKYHIHEWAALFKAATWEEIRMIAGKDEYLQEASETIYRMSADELVRKRCRDREEYYQDLRSYERAIEKYERDKEEHEQDLRNYERAIEKYERDRKEHEQDLRNYERAIEKYERDRKEHEQNLKNFQKALSESENTVREMEEQIQKLRAENERLKQKTL